MWNKNMKRKTNTIYLRKCLYSYKILKIIVKWKICLEGNKRIYLRIDN